MVRRIGSHLRSNHSHWLLRKIHHLVRLGKRFSSLGLFVPRRAEQTVSIHVHRPTAYRVCHLYHHTHRNAVYSLDGELKQSLSQCLLPFCFAMTICCARSLTRCLLCVRDIWYMYVHGVCSLDSLVLCGSTHASDTDDRLIILCLLLPAVLQLRLRQRDDDTSAQDDGVWYGQKDWCARVDTASWP